MDGEQGSATTLGLEQFVFVLKRQWRIIVAATVLGAVLAAGFLMLAPRTVTATTTVNLNAITTEPFNAQRATSGLLDDATETAIARSHVVAARASELLEADLTAREIRAASSVTTASGAAVVTVAFEAATEGVAVRGADAVAAAYLAFRSEKAQERIAVMVGSLTERIDALNSRLGEVNETLVSARDGSVARAQASTQQQQILTELDGLLSERNGLQSVDTTGGIVLSAAADNDPAYSPGRTITLLTGLAAGLIFGIIAAFVRNPFDRRLRNAAEMVRVLGAPVMAIVEAPAGRVPATGANAEALRVARERLLVEIEAGSTMLLVDATRSQHGSATGANLAIITAQAGYDVQLIVPDASAHLVSALEAALGIEMVDGVPARSVQTPSLRVLVTRAGVEHEGDLLLTQETLSAIEESGENELTFLMLPSSAHAASMLAALRVAHSTLLLLQERTSQNTEVRWVRDEAADLGVTLLGAIAEKRGKATERTSAVVGSVSMTAARMSATARAEEARPDAADVALEADEPGAGQAELDEAELKR